MQAAFLFLLILFLIILGILISMLYVVRQQSVAIVERFGRYQKIATSGIHMRLPFGIDKIQLVFNYVCFKVRLWLKPRQCLCYDECGYSVSCK